VVSQQPAAGSSAKQGARVALVVSSGPGTTPLIDVTGLSAPKAEAKLHEAHYHTKRKLEASKTVKSGLVIGTEPAAETPLRWWSPRGRRRYVCRTSWAAPAKRPKAT
jgi:beta-lactam-binding protein with PASTA domain